MRKLVIFFVFLRFVTIAQINDTTIAVPLIGVHFGGDVPFGDMATLYGPNLNTGINFMYKTKKNYLMGIDGNYMFSKTLRQDVLKQLRIEDGTIIDNSGYPADIRVSERVVNVNLYFGKVFHVLSANPNSGLMITGGAGYMQHRVHFVDAQFQVAGINGDIRNGLDHLSNGVSLYQFVGYMFLSNNRLLNFYTGFESYQGFTKSVRKWNYDTGTADTQRKTDILLGFRVGWILPLYSRTPKQYFYN